MYVKNEVGDKIYVWTIGGGRAKKNTECIISAHACQTILNSEFKVDGATFAFYALHGYALLDPSLYSILSGEVKPCEIVKDGKCQDYSLGKFQGAKHGSGRERYEDIELLGMTDDEMLQKGCKREDLSKRTQLQHMDIVTIRFRRFRTDPTLFEVVKELRKNGWGYKTYHCCFCRSAGAPWQKDKGDWDATKRAAVAPKTS
jgi:hypothetical protein